MANIQIFEINEDGELLVNDPALAGALQELTPEELKITGGDTNTCTINYCNTIPPITIMIA
ncbi:MAG: hypothetical protein ACKPEQ_04410 [Dolichospermum sp.]